MVGESIITIDNIKNSFDKSGISFPMDGSKDKAFIFPSENEIYKPPNVSHKKEKKR